MSPISLIDAIRTCFPRTTEKHDPDQILDYLKSIDFRDRFGEEFEDQFVIARSIPLAPRNLSKWIPANLLTDQEPYNAMLFLFSKMLGLDWIPQLHPLIATETELVIDEAQAIKDKREQGLYITKHIRMMLIGAIYHFTDKKDLKDALGYINEWSDYFSDTAGCHSDGLVDREAAAINNFKREVAV